MRLRSGSATTLTRVCLVALVGGLGLSACGDSGSDDEVGETAGSEESADTESTESESTESESTTETETETDTTETDTTETDTTETETDTTETETETDTTETGEPDACSGPCGTPGCLPCPDNVTVDGGGFQIDSTEVEAVDYAVFLSENFDPDYFSSWLPETCGWKGDALIPAFIPDEWSDQPVDGVPAVGVDWCDAWAYCSWAGMRLCGDVEGGSVLVEDVEDPVSNQWFRACSNSGVNLYPYGQLYDADNCNGLDAGFGQAVDVGGLSGCEGGVPGLFDMSGNVWEWTDSCLEGVNTPANEQECRRRGGSWFSDGPTLRCGINSLRARDFRADSVGFRCCEL